MTEIVKINRNYEVVERYRSFPETMRKENLSWNFIDNRCKRKIAREFEPIGYSFRYANDACIKTSHAPKDKRYREIAQMDLGGNVMRIFESIKEAAAATHVDKNTVWMHVTRRSGKKKNVLGFTFKYLEEQE